MVEPGDLRASLSECPRTASRFSLDQGRCDAFALTAISVQQLVDQAADVVGQERLFQERPLGLGEKALGGLAQSIAGF